MVLRHLNKNLRLPVQNFSKASTINLKLLCFSVVNPLQNQGLKVLILFLNLKFLWGFGVSEVLTLESEWDFM